MCWTLRRCAAASGRRSRCCRKSAGKRRCASGERKRVCGASALHCCFAPRGSNRRLPAANTESRISPAGRIFHSRTAARSPRLPRATLRLGWTLRRSPLRAAPRRALSRSRSGNIWKPERRFAYLWTRKEAVLKCTGAGLSQPMNVFSVLGDTASPEGALLSLYTVEYGNYMLSAAAARSAVFTPQRVDALELL